MTAKETATTAAAGLAEFIGGTFIGLVAVVVGAGVLGAKGSALTAVSLLVTGGVHQHRSGRRGFAAGLALSAIFVGSFVTMVALALADFPQ